VPLVARGAVLAEVESALAAARSGRGTLLAVTGEPGVGKTRLAEAAAEQAAGFEVIWTWCPSAAGGAALRPWSRVVRVLAGGHAPASRLIASSPFLAALADPDQAEGRPDPEGARSQLSYDLAEVIAAAASRQPVLIVIDDAHQADASSLRLLAELVPALRTMAAAVLVTARDGDRDWHGRLDLRGALLRSGLAISLRPFDDADVAAVVADLTGGPAAPDLVRVIAERSAGNPFLVTELARQLAGGSAGLEAARAIVPGSVRAIRPTWTRRPCSGACRTTGASARTGAWCCPAGSSSATPITTRSSPPGTPTPARPGTCRSSSPAPSSSSSARPAR
jgi:AAA ATPase-like protein